MKLTRLCALLLCPLFFAACAEVQPRITQSSQVVLDQGVTASPLHIYVKPRTAPMRGLTAVYIPFRVTQNLEQPRLIGEQVMAAFWQTWMEKELFATQSMLSDAYYHSRQEVCRLGREKGADLVITGEISHFLDGGSNSDSAASLRIDIYDPNSEELLWSLAQAGRMERVLTEDYIWFRRTYRLPNSAMTAIVRRIAENMAFPIREWSNQYGVATTSDQIAQGLLGRSASGGVTESSRVVPESRASGSFKAMEFGPDGKERQITEKDPLTGVNLQVEFDFDKWDIRPDAAKILDELGKALTTPELKGNRFTLRGHTDNVGTEEYNMRLSLRRANSVKDYLAKKFGINPKTLTPKGYGESMPVASNDTDQGRQLNRRVEVVREK